ncbi:MAG TPA: hypothetical protein PLL06_02460, partial [Acidobacteriota bacterium]|nr:hypothetical protein [Acidobacteriota bacterium]HNB71103.1 hypothetical protein [Acidobacteriota bacterium]
TKNQERRTKNEEPRTKNQARSSFQSGAHLTESCAGMQFLTRKEMGDFSLFEGLFESHQGRGEPRIGKIS